MPLIWTAKLGRPGLPFFLFAPAVVAVAILFTWVYNSTRGSLLIVLLFHAAFNFTVKLCPSFRMRLPAWGLPLSPWDCFGR
jgi:membrane protease YdiL (CAAX protease family)